MNDNVPTTFVETDFARFFVPLVHQLKDNDHYIYRHANGVCVIGIPPTHPAVVAASREGAHVRVTFEKADSAGRTGKRKRQAREVNLGTKIATVAVSDSSSGDNESLFVVRSVVRGRLVDLSKLYHEGATRDNARLLAAKCLDEGYFAVVQEYASNNKFQPETAAVEAAAATTTTTTSTTSRAEAARIGAVGVVPPNSMDASSFAAERRLNLNDLLPYSKKRWKECLTPQNV